MGADKNPSGDAAFLSHAIGTTKWCASTPGPLRTMSLSTVGILAARGTSAVSAMTPCKMRMVCQKLAFNFHQY